MRNLKPFQREVVHPIARASPLPYDPQNAGYFLPKASTKHDFSPKFQNHRSQWIPGMRHGQKTARF